MLSSVARMSSTRMFSTVLGGRIRLDSVGTRPDLGPIQGHARLERLGTSENGAKSIRLKVMPVEE